MRTNNRKTGNTTDVTDVDCREVQQMRLIEIQTHATQALTLVVSNDIIAMGTSMLRQHHY